MTAYNISSYAGLKTMKDDRAGDYTLTADIDAGASASENASGGVYQGFEPVGLVATRFTGTFDGDGYKIKNLYINRTTIDYVGFLGYVDRAAAGGFIKDVTIESADITGRSGCGVLAGYINTGGSGVMAVSNVVVSGTVKANRTSAGGFVGNTANSNTLSFTNCSSSAAVSKKGTATETATVVIGGFIGNSGGANVVYDGCLASGSVSWSQTATQSRDYEIGGFTGSGTTADYDNCTATGDVALDVVTTGTVYVGGFVGNEGGGTTAIDECFAYGDVTNSTTTAASEVGGFAGYTLADINKCGAEGNIENACMHATTNRTGGFAGYAATSNIANCYAKGAVCNVNGIGHASAYLGGFVGYLDGVALQYCYSAGAVYATGTVTNGGGFGGGNSGGASAYTNCYWDIETSNWESSDGGGGRTTAQMKVQITFTNWDFDDIWELSTHTRIPGSGTTVWLSEVADYEDFEEGVNDADSFPVTIPTTNRILWVEALESLIAGTGGDEWKIASNDFGTPITPTNNTIRQQTNYGSKAMQALKVNESILFVDFVGRKIRELTYSEEFGKHVAPDLSSLAEHITYSGITSIAHQRNPDSIIWCTLTDGSLISMTYERDQNVVAWADHPIDGLVQSVCVIPRAVEDEVWITVKRTMAGVNSGVFVIYIERMASRTFTDIDDCFFVDSGRTIEHSYAATTTIAGLLHLEGETVALLGDGVDLDTYTVSSGIITASTAVTTAQVGSAYTSKLQPMKPVIGTQMGTSAASIVKVPEMGISLLDSAGVKYGTSDSALYDIDLDDARWVNLSEIDDLFTGTVTVATDGGFSLEAPLIISSSSPLPLTVRALIPRMDVTGR